MVSTGVADDDLPLLLALTGAALAAAAGCAAAGSAAAAAAAAGCADGGLLAAFAAGCADGGLLAAFAAPLLLDLDFDVDAAADDDDAAAGCADGGVLAGLVPAVVNNLLNLLFPLLVALIAASPTAFSGVGASLLLLRGRPPAGLS